VIAKVASLDDWRFVESSGGGDDLTIGNVRVWGEEWRSTGEALVLPDPVNPRWTRDLMIYEIGPPEAPVRFAGGEFSNGVFGFYEPISSLRA
jgi:hypothetical protein